MAAKFYREAKLQSLMVSEATVTSTFTNEGLKAQDEGVWLLRQRITVQAGLKLTILLLQSSVHAWPRWLRWSNLHSCL